MTEFVSDKSYYDPAAAEPLYLVERDGKYRRGTHRLATPKLYRHNPGLEPGERLVRVQIVLLGEPQEGNS